MTSSDSTVDRQAGPAPAAAGGAAVGPGRIIRLARENASLGVDELAKLTRLSRATLDALERDDFTALGEPVYVRGYYRKCSKALSLAESELIAAYERLAVPKAPQAPTKLLIGSGETRFGKGRRGQWRWLVWVLLLGAVLGAGARFVHSLPGYSFSLRPSLSTPPAGQAAGAPAAAETGAPTAPAAATAPAAEPPAATAAPTAAAAADAPAQLAAAAPQPAAEPALASGNAPAAAPPPAGEPAASAGASSAIAAAGAATLELSFKSASWVRVEDSTGAVLLSGTVQAGNQQSVSGKPPYALFIGNAPGVSVVFGGKAVDLQPYIKQNDTARFTLPASAGG
ncbi:MAG: DUF4115 domain-containing protein [Nevskia sp.]|nr:DUF4115 domain-containing protein [Nevskia sp.]